ncbi:hypothetical protein Y5S_03622 [Alcanivorax nanhaiticus]|uniref:Chromosome segregation ATPase n=1 Tax=Alcanivorax nanhaiticus TaxID=1177154 RepID=A0A095SDQ8_9GAMM|nr:hypothetical protein [Alcanivorax nanhaiticus]KGD62667.1 hypothetical protein Y5S_03622 [Alcanivorax nanhaiticus]
MGHKLLAAATLMLVTTASAWAEPSESAIEDKRAATESVEIQQDNPLEALSGLSFAEKGQAMQMVRRELASLNQQLEILQEELQQQWQTLPEQARLSRHEALSALKQEQQDLADAYVGIQEASEDNWERAMDRVEKHWSAFQARWQSFKAEIQS